MRIPVAPAIGGDGDGREGNIPRTRTLTHEQGGHKGPGRDNGSLCVRGPLLARGNDC